MHYFAGPLDYIKRVTSRIITRPKTEKDQQVREQEHQQVISDDHLEKLLEQEDDKAINVNQTEADVHDVGREQTIGHFEIVKRVVHQSGLFCPGRCIVSITLTTSSSLVSGCSS
ncbi:hypothetical protein MKX01_036413 [Papaver californicum]|nr:hypothetical protein MKX01_036413 [Papaver californicum]